MKKIIIIIILFSISIPFIPSFSWSRTGHELIADIAYARLTASTRRKINNLTTVMFHSRSAKVRFLKASTWPDTMIYFDVTAFKHWHYISLPFSVDGTKTKPANKYNVAWAIQQSVKVLASPRANRYEKAWFLNFLLHFVGDIHQPLHCINRYSKDFPDGDFGGNLFLIQSHKANNLHQFWDEGAGLFSRRRLSLYQLNQFAKEITKKYPPTYFAARTKNMDPWSWANECYRLAKQTAYQIQPNSIPSSSYDKMAKKITRQQIALAGYRLANMLNIAFSHGVKPT